MPSLNSASVRVRTRWVLPPCRAPARTPTAANCSTSSSTAIWVFTNRMRAARAGRRSTRRSANLSCGGTSSTWWSIESTRRRRPARSSASTGSVRNRLTSESTSLSRVAEKSSRWPRSGVMREQLGDVGQEAHVGHLVGLVEHGDLDRVELADAALDQVTEAAGRRDEHVDTALERPDLPVVGDAADGGLAEQRRSALASGVNASLTCMASSRVGTRIRALGGAARSGRSPRAGQASAGRRRASCPSRSAHGRARHGRRARRGWSPPGSGTASVMPALASARTNLLGQAEPGETGPLDFLDGFELIGSFEDGGVRTGVSEQQGAGTFRLETLQPIRSRPLTPRSRCHGSLFLGYTGEHLIHERLGERDGEVAAHHERQHDDRNDDHNFQVAGLGRLVDGSRPRPLPACLDSRCARSMSRSSPRAAAAVGRAVATGVTGCPP